MNEIAPSSDDDIVIQIALSENRVLITSDVRLASRTLWEPQSNIPTILLRLESLDHRIAAKLVATTLQQRSDWHMLHSVISPQKLRTRPKLHLISE